MRFKKGKTVYYVGHSWDGSSAKWSTYDYYTDRAQQWLLLNPKDFDKKWESIVKELQPNSALYFTPMSKYPRFKLKDSCFKRVIKKEKANYMVCCEKPRLYNRQAVIILENDDAYYVVSKSWGGQYSMAQSYNQDPLAWITAKGIYPKDAVKIFDGTYVEVLSTKQADFICAIMDGEYNNIVFDKDVDKIINGSQTQLTEDSLNTIMGMLDSEDSQNVDLGLKLLTGFNINEMLLSVFLMIVTRRKLQYTSAWNSVGVKQIKETIGFTQFMDFPQHFWKDNYPKPASDLDKELSRQVIIDATKRYVGDVLRPLKEKTIFTDCNISITYDVS